jgi:hypothetical protein
MRSSIPRWTSAAASALVLAGAASGCAPSVRSASEQAAHAAVPALTQSTIETFEDPETRAAVAGIIATPEVRAVMKEISADLARGVVDGLTEEQASARLSELIERLLRAVVEAIAPEASTIARRAVDAAFDDALSGRRQADLGRIAGAMAVATMQSASNELPGTLGPALRRTMTEQLGPAFVDSLRSEEMKSALSEVSYVAAHSAAIGTNDGLAELAERRKREGGGTPLGDLQLLFAKRTWLLMALIIAAVLAIPLLFFVYERRLARRDREELRALVRRQLQTPAPQPA